MTKFVSSRNGKTYQQVKLKDGKPCPKPTDSCRVCPLSPRVASPNEETMGHYLQHCVAGHTEGRYSCKAPVGYTWEEVKPTKGYVLRYFKDE